MLRNHILSLFLLSATLVLRAQDPLKETPGAAVVDKVYEMFDVQVPPSFPGGEKALMKYLAQNIDFPPAARERNVQGTVVVQFVVRKNGSITDIMVTKPVGGGCSEEAARVVGKMPRWTPGQVNGESVNVRYALPVRFRLV